MAVVEFGAEPAARHAGATPRPGDPGARPTEGDRVDHHDPLERRRAGAVDQLLARLRAIAAERGWNTVRWI
ncbi:hypothetical protein ACFWNL_36350, partial [Kitasatospora sp. NPDC058397]